MIAVTRPPDDRTQTDVDVQPDCLSKTITVASGSVSVGPRLRTLDLVAGPSPIQTRLTIL